MERSKDRRRTTHVIRQTRFARFWMVPYHTGWHLAHHVDMRVPGATCPVCTRELVTSGWLVPDIEYPTYRAFWKACSAGAPREAAHADPTLGASSAAPAPSSFLDFS